MVTNVPDYCLIEVAEHALALLLAQAHKVAFYHWETKSGRYQLQSGPPMHRLEGQTLGIVGLGNIGRRLAAKAAAIGLKVLATGAQATPEAICRRASLGANSTRYSSKATTSVCSSADA